MKLTRDIQSLSVFKRDSSKFMLQMKKTGQPIVLTVNGKAAMVIQDADSFQKDYENLQRLVAENGSELKIPRYFEPAFDS
ncbi:MAG: type II toxin-antitoxin system Phd/YefM family antitoxin [Saprospiraceae bacterium]|nr:type II toxin-antitoxin system Phd/YefM family antitoxin [Pyrinomonadaceae bacterium]